MHTLALMNRWCDHEPLGMKGNAYNSELLYPNFACFILFLNLKCTILEFFLFDIITVNLFLFTLLKPGRAILILCRISWILLSNLWSCCYAIINSTVCVFICIFFWHWQLQINNLVIPCITRIFIYNHYTMPKVDTDEHARTHTHSWIDNCITVSFLFSMNVRGIGVRIFHLRLQS